MKAKSLTYDELVASIFDERQPVSTGRLAQLTHLNQEQFGLFSKSWSLASKKRRWQIVSDLVQLAEDNLELDFDVIFGFCLAETDDEVRLKALSGLQNTEDPVFVNPVIRVLKEDASARVRAEAATVLGRFALMAEMEELPGRYREPVYTALRDTLTSERETTEVKRRALESIAPFSRPEVEGFIDRAYGSLNDGLKASAVCAMGRNCNAKWLPIVIEELGNTQAEIRYEAAMACCELEDMRAVPFLIDRLEDEDAQVQDAAITALGKIGGGEAKESLKALLNNRDSRVREAARAALQELLFWEEPLSFEH